MKLLLILFFGVVHSAILVRATSTPSMLEEVTPEMRNKIIDVRDAIIVPMNPRVRSENLSEKTMNINEIGANDPQIRNGLRWGDYDESPEEYRNDLVRFTDSPDGSLENDSKY